MSNKRIFRQNNWRDRVTYINQYESENSNYVSTVVRKQKGKRHASFRKTEKYLAEKELDLTATLDAKSAYSDAEIVIIAAPTNYDPKKNYFDTSAVEAVIELVMQYNPSAYMVIKWMRTATP